MTRKSLLIFPASVLLAFFFMFSCLSNTALACTTGCASGEITPDGRPLLWKVNNGPLSNEKRLFWVPPQADKLGYVLITQPASNSATSGPVDRYCFGLNEKGLSIAYTIVDGEPENPTAGFRRVLLDIIQTKKRIPDIKDISGNIIEAGVINYLDTKVSKMTGAQGCYTVMDGDGNTLVFELIRESASKVKAVKYDPLAVDRKEQDLFEFKPIHSLHGFIIRANELHNQINSLDITNTKGRYHSGTYNVLGMIYGETGNNKLTPLQLLQGDGNMPDNGFEFIRFGAGEPTSIDDMRGTRTIAMRRTSAAEVIQGVYFDEDPLFTTMWSVFGNSNYSIAVPIWVTVEDIPDILNYKDFGSRRKPHNLYMASKRLTHIVTNYYHDYKNLKNEINQNATNNFAILEANIQKTIFPFEKRLLDRINNDLLPIWKEEGTTNRIVKDMERVETQMADDAYSVINYFNDYFYDNSIVYQDTSLITVKSIIDNKLKYPDPESEMFKCYHEENPKCRINKTPIPKTAYIAPSVFIDKVTFNGDYKVDFTYKYIGNKIDPKTIVWNFGDNSQAVTSPHTFSRPGRYLVSCTATDAKGMSDTDWLHITVGGIVGQWDFNQRLPKDTGNSSIGNDLILSPATAVVKTELSGILNSKYDKKVTVGTGDYFSMNIGSGTLDEWTIVFDVYHNNSKTMLLQTDSTNSNNADFWINSVGKIVIEQDKGLTGNIKKEFSTGKVNQNEWSRVILTMKATETIIGSTEIPAEYSFYSINSAGKFFNQKNKKVQEEVVLKKFNLNGKILLFADENKQDNPIDVSMVAFFDKVLSENEVKQLGGPGETF